MKIISIMLKLLLVLMNNYLKVIVVSGGRLYHSRKKSKVY